MIIKNRMIPQNTSDQNIILTKMPSFQNSWKTVFCPYTTITA